MIAQFHCELAELARAQGARETARAHVADAFSAEPDCVRAHMIEGHLESSSGHLELAIRAFERVAELDVDYVPEILSPILDCYARAQRMQQAEEFLLGVTERYQGISPVLALAKMYTTTRGEAAAAEFLNHVLRERPSVRAMMAMIDVTLRTVSGDARENFLILRDLTNKLVEGKSMYRCSQCGFGAKAHHWQCPSCKNWGTVRPIHGVVGE